MTTIDVSDGGGIVTVAVVAPATPAREAVIVAVPTPTPVAMPPPAMVKMACELDVQETAPVRSADEPSLYMPVAIICLVWPPTMDGFGGLTDIELSVGAVTLIVVTAVTPPVDAVTVAMPV